MSDDDDGDNDDQAFEDDFEDYYEDECAPTTSMLSPHYQLTN